MILNKAIFGIVGGGALIGVATGVYFYFRDNSSTIKEVFEKNKGSKSNLTKSVSDKQPWFDKWKAYITDNTVSNQKNNPWNVGSWEKNKENLTNVPTEFAESCENKLDDKITGLQDQKYLNFLKWCVK